MGAPTVPTRTSFPLSTDDGREVWVHRWGSAEPGPSRGVVHLLHGAGEHALRYDHLANALVRAGFEVFADDHLAHGETGLAASRLGRIGRGQNRAALRAVAEVALHIRAQRPGRPLVVFGHSWGSLLAQQLFARHHGLVDGMILTGTTLALPGWINAGRMNARFEPDDTGLSWLSRDPAVAEAFANDPLTFDIARTPPWSPIGRLQLLHLPPGRLRGRIDELPLLVLAGSEDAISHGARGARALVRCYRRRTGLSDVSYREYPGARHELVNERNRDEVIGDIVAWLVERWPLRSQWCGTPSEAK